MSNAYPLGPTTSPAPWKHVEVRYEDEPAGNYYDPCLVSHYVVDANGGDVCDAFTGPDAELIVAAPELLAACRLARGVLFWVVDSGDDTGETDGAAAALKALDAALKKATDPTPRKETMVTDPTAEAEAARRALRAGTGPGLSPDTTPARPGTATDDAVGKALAAVRCAGRPRPVMPAALAAEVADLVAESARHLAHAVRLLRGHYAHPDSPGEYRESEYPPGLSDAWGHLEAEAKAVADSARGFRGYRPAATD